MKGKRALGAKLVLRGRLRPAAAKGHLRLKIRGRTRTVKVGAEGWFKTTFPSDRAGRTKWTLKLVPASGYTRRRPQGSAAPQGAEPRAGLVAAGQCSSSRSACASSTT